MSPRHAHLETVNLISDWGCEIRELGGLLGFLFTKQISQLFLFVTQVVCGCCFVLLFNYSKKKLKSCPPALSQKSRPASLCSSFVIITRTHHSFLACLPRNLINPLFLLDRRNFDLLGLLLLSFWVLRIAGFVKVLSFLVIFSRC